MGELRAIAKEIRRLMEALRGKWSFESWMDTIGHFTDDVIRKARTEEGLQYGERTAVCSAPAQRRRTPYVDGTCAVDASNPLEVTAHVELFFRSDENQVVKYEAERKFPKRKFLSEVLERWRDSDTMRFPIDAPDERTEDSGKWN